MNNLPNAKSTILYLANLVFSENMPIGIRVVDDRYFEVKVEPRRAFGTWTLRISADLVLNAPPDIMIQRAFGELLEFRRRVEEDVLGVVKYPDPHKREIVVPRVQHKDETVVPRVQCN